MINQRKMRPLLETQNCSIEPFKYEWNNLSTYKIILHRIISVVNLASFFTRNFDSIHSRWRVTTVTSEREAGGECNRLEGIYSRPLMNVPIATLMWWIEAVSLFWVVFLNSIKLINIFCTQLLNTKSLSTKSKIYRCIFSFHVSVDFSFLRLSLSPSVLRDIIRCVFNILITNSTSPCNNFEPVINCQLELYFYHFYKSQTSTSSFSGRVA